MSNHANTVCPHFHKAIELIGRRWTGAVLQVLMKGRTRYCDIRDAIPEVSDRMLSERLKELESEGIVVRVVMPEHPGARRVRAERQRARPRARAGRRIEVGGGVEGSRPGSAQGARQSGVGVHRSAQLVHPHVLVVAVRNVDGAGTE